jgi:hypothetical protein
MDNKLMKVFIKISIKVFILLMLSVGLASAQTAQVIQLSPEEALRAKSLYDQKTSIDKQIEYLQAEIADKYIENKNLTLQGWMWGFEYSTDFKFIVPLKPNQNSPVSGSGSTSWINGGCTYVIPANSTDIIGGFNVTPLATTTLTLR